MIKDKKLLIVGIGETGILAYEYFANDSEYEVVAFFADKEFVVESTFNGLPLLAIDEMKNYYSPDEFYAFVAMGSGHLNRDRASIYNRVKELGFKLASYVSSHAFVWKNVEIGENCLILEDNTLQPFTKIGDNVVLWSGNHVGHRTIIENHCFITSHVVISGFCRIGAYSFIGVNAAFADGITVGLDNFIGMGTIVNKSTEADGFYVGNPAVKRNISAKRFCKVS
ncbi:acetyltransferase [Gammaproteobacteria bacterium LSUCC0112]|nr:acetyltransferase [Gammaproteobacteria bacterium LSUCC0112]